MGLSFSSSSHRRLHSFIYTLTVFGPSFCVSSFWFFTPVCHPERSEAPAERSRRTPLLPRSRILQEGISTRTVRAFVLQVLPFEVKFFPKKEGQVPRCKQSEIFN